MYVTGWVNRRAGVSNKLPGRKARKKDREKSWIGGQPSGVFKRYKKIVQREHGSGSRNPQNS